MTLTWRDARDRRVVRLADGRTATLIAIRTPGQPHGHGPTLGTAHVRLPSGAYLNVRATSLTVEGTI